MPRMTFKESFDDQPGTLESAVLIYSLDAIVGAGRVESAAVSKEGTDGQLIQTDQ